MGNQLLLHGSRCWINPAYALVEISRQLQKNVAECYSAATTMGLTKNHKDLCTRKLTKAKNACMHIIFHMCTLSTL